MEKGIERYNITSSKAFLAIAIFHIILIGIMAVFGCKWLIVYNVISSIIYMILSGAAKTNGMSKSIFAVFFIEIIAFTSVSSVLLGLGAGFTFYIIGLIPVIFCSIYLSKDSNIAKSISYSSIMLLDFYAIVALDFWGGFRIYNINKIGLNTLFIFNSVLGFALVIGFLVVFTATAKDEKDKLLNDRMNLVNTANYDELTKLLNRRSLDHYMTEFFKNAAGYGRDFTVLMGDIDDFKKVNDTYGHDTGDQVLVMVASTLKGLLRSNDIIFRWGGEEILILINGGKKEASLVAERCRVAIEQNDSVIKDGKKIMVTMTIGGCSYYQGATRDSMIERADKNLYKGKKNGKNQIVMI